MNLVDAGQGIHGLLIYNSDLFVAETINRMIGHYCVMVESIAGNPDQSICDLPILTTAERHELFIKRNETGGRWPDVSIQGAFSQEVSQRPEAVAVVCDRRQVTYGELNRRANQLGWYLMGLGVGPEVRVGICVDRSPEMVVALLGIVKAGGVYVPLDPSYPPRRISLLLEDSAVQVLLTTERLADELPANSAQLVLIDSRLGNDFGES